MSNWVELITYIHIICIRVFEDIMKLKFLILVGAGEVQFNYKEWHFILWFIIDGNNFIFLEFDAWINEWMSSWQSREVLQRILTEFKVICLSLIFYALNFFWVFGVAIKSWKGNWYLNFLYTSGVSFFQLIMLN